MSYTNTFRVIGVIMYGSHSTGRADHLSDQDIAVIIEGGREHYEYIESRNHDLDIAYISKERLEEVVEETYNRLNHNLWLTHSLYLKILTTGKIIYDPHRLLENYKDAVKQWKWTIEDIVNTREHSRKIVEYTIKEYESNYTLEASILLGDARNVYLIIKELKNNVPSPQHKDLYETAKKYALQKQYITIHRLNQVKEEVILEIISLIKDEKYPYMKQNMKSIKRLLIRGEKLKALLTARKVYSE